MLYGIVNYCVVEKYEEEIIMMTIPTIHPVNDINFDDISGLFISSFQG